MENERGVLSSTNAPLILREVQVWLISVKFMTDNDNDLHDDSYDLHNDSLSPL